MLLLLEISVKVKGLSQGHNNKMPKTDIEPATLQSLAWRSNQLNYAAALN